MFSTGDQSDTSTNLEKRVESFVEELKQEVDKPFCNFFRTFLFCILLITIVLAFLVCSLIGLSSYSLVNNRKVFSSLDLRNNTNGTIFLYFETERKSNMTILIISGVVFLFFLLSTFLLLCMELFVIQVLKSLKKLYLFEIEGIMNRRFPDFTRFFYESHYFSSLFLNISGQVDNWAGFIPKHLLPKSSKSEVDEYVNDILDFDNFVKRTKSETSHFFEEHRKSSNSSPVPKLNIPPQPTNGIPKTQAPTTTEINISSPKKDLPKTASVKSLDMDRNELTVLNNTPSRHSIGGEYALKEKGSNNSPPSFQRPPMRQKTSIFDLLKLTPKIKRNKIVPINSMEKYQSMRTTREIVILKTRLNNIHELLKSGNTLDFNDVHGKALGIITTIVEQGGGYVLDFEYDEVTIVWNIFDDEFTNSTAVENAALCALKIISSIDALIKDLENLEKKKKDKEERELLENEGFKMDTICAIVNGTCICSTLGTRRNKRVRVFGEKAELASKLLRIAELWRVKVIACDKTSSVLNLCGSFFFREIDRVKIESRYNPIGSISPKSIYEIMGCTTFKSHINFDDILKEYKTAIQKFFQGDVQDTLASLNELAFVWEKDSVIEKRLEICTDLMMEIAQGIARQNFNSKFSSRLEIVDD